MTMIKIYRDGTFEAVAAAKTPAQIKAELKDVKKDLQTLVVMARVRTQIELRRTTLKHDKKPAVQESTKRQIEALKTKLATLRESRKYPRLSDVALTKRARALQAELTAGVKLPKLDGPKPSREAPATKRTPRAPKDHGAAFERTAKQMSAQTKRDVKGSLAEHAKTSLVRVAARPGAQAAKAPVAKTTEKSIAKPATKLSDSATSSVLKVIKQIKLDLETTKPGPKADRLRTELAKNRKHLRELRAGKTAKNQAHIAPKISAKKAGMGTPAKKTVTDREKLRIAKAERTRLRAAAKDAKGPKYVSLQGNISRLTREIERLTAKIANA